MATESVVNIYDAVLIHDDATTNTPAAPLHTSAIAIPAGDDGTSSSNARPMMQLEEQHGSTYVGCFCAYRWPVIILSTIRFVTLAFLSSMSQEWSSFELCMMIVYASMSIFSLVGAIKYRIGLIAIDFVWCVGTYYTYYD